MIYAIDGTMPEPHPSTATPTLAEVCAKAGRGLRVVASHDGAIWYVRETATSAVYARGLTEADSLRYALDREPEPDAPKVAA